jgi:hypothetical protein
LGTIDGVTIKQYKAVWCVEISAGASDGSNIVDWKKYTTPAVTMPNGQRLQVHFYHNVVTGKIDYITSDYKVKGIVKP